MGDAGHHLADDMPDDETHPFFPDHFWPYPIIAVVMLITVGLLAAFVQKNLQLEASADPRAVTIPRPDWYFLFLFQFLKLGPELIMSLVIPPVVVGALLLWPFIDSIAGPRMARRLGWSRWPVPGRNIYTGTGWVVFLGIIAGLTLWALAGPQFCLPWFTGPVCGA
jgi:quinol-cytochrome oxidoreductase complex cytochrome b subunit